PNGDVTGSAATPRGFRSAIQRRSSAPLRRGCVSHRMRLFPDTLGSVPDFCEQKKKLNVELGDAVAAYSHAIRDLSIQVAVVPKEQYEALRAHADVLRLRSETARLALEQHISQHRC